MDIIQNTANLADKAVADYLGNEANNTEQYVKQCDDSSWCCEAQTPPLTNLNNLNSSLQGQVDSCCSQGKGVFINNGIVEKVNPNGTATSSSTTSSSAVTHTISPLSTSMSTSSTHSTNVGAIVGGVLGGVAALVIIAVAIIFCRRSRGKRRTNKNGGFLQDTKDTARGTEHHEKYGNERFEKDGTQMAQLMGEREGPYEL